MIELYPLYPGKKNFTVVITTQHNPNSSSEFDGDIIYVTPMVEKCLTAEAIEKYIEGYMPNSDLLGNHCVITISIFESLTAANPHIHVYHGYASFTYINGCRTNVEIGIEGDDKPSKTFAHFIDAPALEVIERIKLRMQAKLQNYSEGGSIIMTETKRIPNTVGIDGTFHLTVDHYVPLEGIDTGLTGTHAISYIDEISKKRLDEMIANFDPITHSNSSMTTVLFSIFRWNRYPPDQENHYLYWGFHSRTYKDNGVIHEETLSRCHSNEIWVCEEIITNPAKLLTLKRILLFSEGIRSL